jgi:hypothetical protein
MNLFFKIILITSLFTKVHARDLFIISYKKKSFNRAESIKRLLIRNHRLPKKVIKLRELNSPCIRQETSLLHICINKDNKYRIINKNEEVLHRSFSHFKK